MFCTALNQKLKPWMSPPVTSFCRQFTSRKTFRMFSGDKGLVCQMIGSPNIRDNLRAARWDQDTQYRLFLRERDVFISIEWEAGIGRATRFLSAQFNWKYNNLMINRLKYVPHIRNCNWKGDNARRQASNTVRIYRHYAYIPTPSFQFFFGGNRGNKDKILNLV
jgi:hypothetical protein